MRHSAKVRWTALLVMVAGCWPHCVQAQSTDHVTVAARGGVGRSGAGNIADCCGPYTSELEHSKSIWIGAGAYRWVAPRFGLEADATWARDDPYDAYFQGFIGNAPYRGYHATNRLRAFTLDALVRYRAFQSGAYELDVVSGAGWVMESWTNHLQSISFSPDIYSYSPDYMFDLRQTRHRTAAVLGAEIGGPGFGSHFEIFATLQVRLNLGRADEVRNDLELGRTIWRVGLGVRRAF